MKVLIVHNDYGKPSGEEHALGTIIDLLKTNDHEVLEFRKSSVPLMNGGIGIQAKAFFSGIHSFSSAREIDRFLSENEVDVVQLQNVFPFLSPSVIPVIKKHGIPIVMRCPNYRLSCPSGLHLRNGAVCEKCVGGKEWNCFTNNCEGNLIKSLGYAMRSGWARFRKTYLNHVDRFLVLSEFQKKRFVEGGIPAERIAIFPNFSRIVRDEAPPANKIGDTISFVGRLAPEKGIELFIEAARRLPDLKFSAAGDHAWVDQSGCELPPNLTLRGFLAGEELSQFYQESKMLCFPCQWYEGFPNVIITAMEHKKPVVAGRIGALPEIVLEGQTGLLHDPPSIDELVACIQKLDADESLCRQFGQQGFERIFSNYHVDTVYPKLIDVYQSVQAPLSTLSN